jgi:PKHD-type hydroxylase
MNENKTLQMQWNLRSEKQKVYWFESAFNEEEIQKIKDIGEKIQFEDGTVFNQIDPKNVRLSSVAWINANPDSEWLFKKLVDLVLHVNSINFNLSIVGIEALQFTVYESSVNGFYGIHTDVFPQSINYLNRKISFTIQMSDPSEYEGGELIIEPLNEVIESKKTKGSITFFESTERHQVKPVTKGVRYALVGWVSGPAIT